MAETGGELAKTVNLHRHRTALLLATELIRPQQGLHVGILMGLLRSSWRGGRRTSLLSGFVYPSLPHAG